MINTLQEASEVVELAYNDYANAAQRLSLLEEFYGPSFTLFKACLMIKNYSLDVFMNLEVDNRDFVNEIHLEFFFCLNV